MSEGLNRVMLLGNLCADPELRFTQSGQAVLNMKLATNESYLDKDKVRRGRVDFHAVVVWGKRGEALAKILAMGSSVFIEGSLRTSSYDDREGNKRYKTEVIANNILLTGGKRGEENGQAQPEPRGGGYGGGGYGRGAPPPGGGGSAARPASGNGRSAGARAPAPPADAGGPPPGNEGGYGAGDPDEDIPFTTCMGAR